MPITLTKTKYMNGLQCLKLLWTVFHEPEKIPAVDAGKQYLFDQGHLVTSLAKKLIPGGIDIPTDDFNGNVRLTKDLLRQRVPLFEAGFLVDKENLYSRVDILNPVGQEGWEIIEVKSSASVKDEHIQDVAFQKYCLGKNGLNVQRCSLMHVNNQYVKNGDIDPGQLLITEDISDKVAEAGIGLQDMINKMVETIRSASCPEIPIGSQCSKPYDCPLNDLCHAFLPERNVFNLYLGGKKITALFEQGILEIKDIPEDFKLTDRQQIQRECARTGECYINHEEISGFLDKINYPVHYLDFETINPIIPLIDGTRPFQQVPFQFSLQVVKKQGSKPQHHSFLAEDTADPRPDFLDHLRMHVDNEGSIVVYNQSFEKGIITDLATAFPEYKDWLNALEPRVIDLIEPFRKFHYHHPSQCGSASIKAVLPAVTGKGYDELEIQEGKAASIAYLAASYGNVTPEEKAKIRQDLLTYCGRDTEGMMWIVEGLRAL
jgi:hypothetical protein